MIELVMNRTTTAVHNGKKYLAGTAHLVPLTVGWRWIDRDLATYVALRPDVAAMPYTGMHVQQDGWRRTISEEQSPS